MNPRAILMLVVGLEMAVVLGGAARYSGINVVARLAAPGGPNNGGNSISVAEAGPNPGGNSEDLKEHAEDSNSIARAKAGPNPGGNSENVMESSDRNSVAAARAGPNPGGNSLGRRKNAERFRMSRPAGHANIE